MTVILKQKHFIKTALLAPVLLASVLLPIGVSALAPPPGSFDCPKDPDFEGAGSYRLAIGHRGSCKDRPRYSFSGGDNSPTIEYRIESSDGSSSLVTTLAMVDPKANPITWRGNASYDNHGIIIALGRTDITDSYSGMKAKRYDTFSAVFKEISIPINDRIRAFANRENIIIQNTTGGSANCTGTAVECDTNADVSCALRSGGNTNNCLLFDKYIIPAINFLSIGVGVVVTALVVVGGITYSTAGGDAKRVRTARLIITNALLSLVGYMFLWSFLQWVIPGGIL